jgi:hypothetical protein
MTVPEAGTYCWRRIAIGMIDNEPGQHEVTTLVRQRVFGIERGRHEGG